MARRILVVEDERPLARALELKLSAAGYEVEVALDGETGLAKIRQGSYDLVLLDLILPKMDGFKVLEELKNERRDVKVVVLSNLGQEEDVEKAKRLGAIDFYVKADTPLATIVEHAAKLLK